MAGRHVACSDPTKENYEQITALAEKGQTGTLRYLAADYGYSYVISGLEPGDKDLGRR